MSKIEIKEAGRELEIASSGPLSAILPDVIDIQRQISDLRRSVEIIRLTVAEKKNATFIWECVIVGSDRSLSQELRIEPKFEPSVLASSSSGIWTLSQLAIAETIRQTAIKLIRDHSVTKIECVWK